MAAAEMIDRLASRRSQSASVASLELSAVPAGDQPGRCGCPIPVREPPSTKVGLAQMYDLLPGSVQADAASWQAGRSNAPCAPERGRSRCINLGA